MKLSDVSERPALLQLSEDEFEEQFGLVTRPAPGFTTLFDAEDIQDIDPNRVWTVIDTDQDDKLYAIPGLHCVNRVGYVVTERPWPHENIEAVYFGGMDDDLDGGMRP